MQSRWVALVAVSIAVALAWAAPGDWESGSATLEVSYRDSSMRVPVELGSSAPLRIEGTLGSVDIAVTAIAGFDLDDSIDINIEVGDSEHRPSLGDVSVTLLRPGGSSEVIPVLTLDHQTFRAARTPPSGSPIVLAILGVAIVLWITESIPLFVTSLGIPVALAVTGVGTASDSLAPFFDPIIVLFFGGFLMAEGMRRANLDRLLAVTIVDVAGRGAVRLYLALIALAAFMSMWMSNTAAVTVLLPIALAVTEPLGSNNYRKVCVLGIAYAATIGGVGSAIGTPANPLALSFIERLTGREISFAEWFGFGLPMVLTFLPIMAWYLWAISDVDVPPGRFHDAAAVAKAQRASAGPLTRSQIQVLGVFGIVMALWLTQSLHGINTGIVALGGAIAMFILGLVEPEDLGRISWPTLLTFGGGLTLGTFMVTTGTSDWLVTRLSGIGAWPDLLALTAVAVVALGLTTVASNTAAAATLIPLSVPLAGIIGAEPVLLVVVVAIASSIDFALVIGTPPTMLAYDTSLFTAREIMAKGAPLDAIGVGLLILLVVPAWRLLGVL